MAYAQNNFHSLLDVIVMKYILVKGTVNVYGIITVRVRKLSLEVLCKMANL